MRPEPVRVRIHKDRRRLGIRQSPHDRGDARTEPFRVAWRVGKPQWICRNLHVQVGNVGRQFQLNRTLLSPGGEDQPVDLNGRVARGKPSVRGSYVCVGVEEMVVAPVGHRVVPPGRVRRT
jgi:hypothetical protein